ncbi:hypothetical protein BCV70DRAFT_197734 [Testicularia cyperi]|uniref:VPS9 domain-containing protein n=1 Tax=Testicularia cyperi TaxID=1882483 RepID=A0A317XZ15_9BASI|nr:hypothetical protein BCV70DRAFT_197734 [Testicularia cyperi]
MASSNQDSITAAATGKADVSSADSAHADPENVDVAITAQAEPGSTMQTAAATALKSAASMAANDPSTAEVDAGPSAKDAAPVWTGIPRSVDVATTAVQHLDLAEPDADPMPPRPELCSERHSPAEHITPESSAQTPSVTDAAAPVDTAGTANSAPKELGDAPFSPGVKYAASYDAKKPEITDMPASATSTKQDESTASDHVESGEVTMQTVDRPLEAPQSTSSTKAPTRESVSAMGEKDVPPPPPPGKSKGADGDTGTIVDPTQARDSSTANGAEATSAPRRESIGGREALADPESVAAVAHAFGRDSPTLPTLPKPDGLDSLDSKTSNKALPSFPRSESGDTTMAAEPKAHLISDPQSGVITGMSRTASAASDAASNASPGNRGIKIGKGPPPTTQASEEIPFDFNRFLEQMKHRTAQPVSEYVRSFIKGFAKKPYRTQDQVKLIFDFLDFIAARMRECEVWQNLSESDFENAKEAIEKLVMNRLYPYTFTPAVQKEGRWAVQTDDLERDRVLKQRMNLFSWLREEHLDVPVGDHSRGFIEFSIQELLKINHYKAPRDKLICILNCCKVIFGMIRHLSTQENADTFIPVLIFVVLKANPDNLISNVEYISRFRSPERLSSESGYYLSSLMGAIAFIETMDYTSLSHITQEEFEKKVEAALSSLPEPEPEPPQAQQQDRSFLSAALSTPPRSSTPLLATPSHQRSVSANSMSTPSGPGEEAAKALPFTPIAASLADDTKAFFQRTGEAARTGLSRPMGALGRLINEGIEGIRTPSSGNSNYDSGASTERQNSPVPPPPSSSLPNSQSGTGMAISTSRSRFFGGLFGATESQIRAASSGSLSQAPAPLNTQQVRSGHATVGLDDEPQTPSTGDLLQEGFAPFQSGRSGSASNAPQRLVRPTLPQRGYSIDDTMFDDETANRRNLAAARTGAGRSDQLLDPYEDDEDDMYVGSGGGSGAGGRGADDTPNAAAAERMRRRRQMQQDFGPGFMPDPLTPSRRSHQSHALAGRGEAGVGNPDAQAQAYEDAQTAEAIQQSLVEQQQMQAVQIEEEAQNSAGVETLKSIFPTMDLSVIQTVLLGCEGNVEVAIDRLLEMQ